MHADDFTTLTGLITGYNESDYRRAVPTLFERSLKLDVLKNKGNGV